MNGRIEKQPNHGNPDNGQQDTARHFQFFQTDNERQANERHDHREAGEMAHRNRQTIQRIFNDQTHAVGGNQQQEQTNTDACAVRDALRQVPQDPATDAGRRNHGKQHTHQEHRTQRNGDADMLTQHQAERGKCGQ
ncbi:hypothetical protein D3C80_1512960 [compost metagenome]